MGKDKVMGNLYFPMDASTKENFKMINNMDMEFLSVIMENFMKVSLKMDRESDMAKENR